MSTRSISLLVVLACSWAGSVSAIPITDYVTVGGNQWAQPVYFTSLSWNDIFNVCGTGTCTGTLTDDSGTWDMDGWTWADVDAVNGLFNTYISDAGSNPYGYPLSGPSSASELNSTWAPAILADFQSTNGPIQLMGWTSTEVHPAAAYVGIVTNFNLPSSDSASTDGFSAKVNEGFGVGAWFVRDAASGVPVPGTLFLLGLGLLGLRVSRQRTM
jgi:PEP-CTERM motif